MNIKTVGELKKELNQWNDDLRIEVDLELNNDEFYGDEINFSIEDTDNFNDCIMLRISPAGIPIDYVKDEIKKEKSTSEAEKLRYVKQYREELINERKNHSH